VRRCSVSALVFNSFGTSPLPSPPVPKHPLTLMRPYFTAHTHIGRMDLLSQHLKCPCYDSLVNGTSEL